MIQVLGLTKHYGQKVAVEQLTFEVRPGRVTGFLGPNGSGKSTTMRMIVGLDTPDAGQALVNGCNFGELAWPLREVGVMLDGRAFHPGRSPEVHLLALAQANAIDRSRVAEVLDQVGLSSVAGQRAGKFSLGMGQRLGIASALLGDPGILLFDEPVNGLDPEGIRWVRHLTQALAAEGRTVLISSHLISEMALTADQLIVIGRGHLIAEMSVAEFNARSPEAVRVRTPETELLMGRLRQAGIIAAPDPDGSLLLTGHRPDVIADLALQAGIPLYELSPERGSLEDVFMELTHDGVEFRAGEPHPANGATPSGVDVPALSRRTR